jgi:Autotransporter beta-domain
LNKRALMLTAATTALLSGQALGATCDSTSTTGNCSISTEITSPLYTGAPTAGVTGAQGNLGNITINTNGSLVIGTTPPLAPAITINSGTTAAPTFVNNTTTISYQGISYAVGTLLQEASVATSTSTYGTPENWVGQYYSAAGVMNLLGAGTNKNGILIAGGAFPGSGLTNAETGIYANNTGATINNGLGLFTGATGGPANSTTPTAIYMAAGSTIEIQGTNSFGINLIGPTYTAIGTSGALQPSGGASLLGDIDVGGAITLEPTTIGSTVQTSNVAINIAGWMQSAAQPTNPAFAGTPYANTAFAMVGNVDILQGGTVSSQGQGAEGIVVLGAINGAVVNAGQLSTFGTSTPSTALNANDPEAGPALVIANNVTGGIFNAGPTNGGTGANQSRASLSMAGDSEAIDIAPAFGQTPVAVTIGGYTDSAGFTYSLLNRGGITASAEDANISNEAIFMSGVSASQGVNLPSGIFNAGTISSSAVSNVNGSTAVNTLSATAIDIGNFVTVGTGTGGTGGTAYALVNSNETSSGTISASISGAQTGTATAVLIEAQRSSGVAGILPSIYNSGSIEASASTTNLESTGIAAYAIRDESGSLTTIYNTGTISATATTLDNNAQVAEAIDTSSNTTTPVTITDVTTGANAAEIVGDIRFGTQHGTLTVTGTNANFPALVTGNLFFNNATATPDTLAINSFATFAGEISEANGGAINIGVLQSGSLDLETSLPTNLNSTVSTAVTANTPLKVQTLNVATGGSLDIALSQGNNVNAFAGRNVTVISAQSATIGGDGISPTLSLTFGGFVSSPSVTGQAAQFVLISTPSGGTFNITPEELTLLTNTYDSSLNPSAATKNGIPFLFNSDICTYNVPGATGNEVCSTGSAPYNPTNQSLVLTLTPKPATGPGGLGLTGFALKMFPYVNEALINDNTLGAAMVNSITNQASAQAAYASFAPDVSGATRATAISLTDSATNVVAARQRSLRMYGNQEGATTLWGQQFGQRLSQANSDTLTGYNDSGFGFVLGMDDGDRVDGRYGGAFTFFTGGMSAKEPTSSKTSSEYYLLTGYTDWRGKGLFVDTQGTIGYGNLKGNRYLTLTDPSTQGTVSRDAQSQRATEMVAGSVTTGGILTAGSTVFMPQVDVDGLTMREEGYAEANGGQGFDLRVQPYYADSLRAFIGTDIRQDFNFGDFYLQPEVRFGYRYDFVSGQVKLKANFSSVSNANGQALNQFSIEGPDPGRGNLVLGGGVATTTGAWSIGLNFDYVKASDGPSEQTGVLTLVGRI